RLDIDDFKTVNDVHGYHSGENAIKTVAEHLRRKTRRCDFPARFAGAEFALILPETNLQRALQVGKKVLLEIKGCAFGSTTKPFYVTASIGVSSTSEKQYFDWHQMLRDANHALGAAKNTGKDRVETLLPESKIKSISPYP
ncbi:MAG: GGDEF domain-containing protein, partial [Candidatus Binatia bacterium]